MIFERLPFVYGKKSDLSISKLIFNSKDVCDKLNHSVVYKLIYLDCNSFYLGQNDRLELTHKFPETDKCFIP